MDEYTWLCSSVTLQSDKRGFFQEFAENVCEIAGDDWIKSFGELKIDKDRILKCYNDPKINTLVRGTLDNVQKIFRGKSGHLSKSKREESEHFLNRGNPEQATMLANLSVARAPFPGVDKTFDEGLSLPLALWVRSKAFQQTQKYRLALNDIQMALKNKLPESYKLEAYERLSQCFLNLGLKKQAEIALKIVINVAKIKENKESEERHEIILNDIDSRLGPEETTDTNELPDLFEGESRAMTYLSSSLSMKRTPDKGRYIIANTEISPGATLSIEEPYSSVLKFEKHGTHCLNCFKRLETVIPCPDCSGVAYCSEDCQISGHLYHKWECQYLELMIGSGMSVLSQLSLRIITQSNLLFILDLVQAIAENLDHPYLQVYNMETHSKQRDPKDFLFRTLMALFLLEILRKSGYFGQFNDLLTDNEVTVGCLLLRHLQLTQYNAHEIYETFVKIEGNKWNLGDTKVHYIGVGIYPSSSMFNHACHPTLARYFIGKNLILKSQRNINKNEEVYENYGMSSILVETEKRQKTLKGRYRFNCNCLACIEKWPILSQMDTQSIKLKCSRRPCIGTYTYKENNPIQNWECSICHQSNDLALQLTQCQNLKKDFDQGFLFMDNLEVEKAVDIFVKFINSSNNVISQPNKYLCMAMEALRTCWAYKNNFYVL